MDEQSQPLKVGAFTRGEVESGDPRLDEIAAQLGATEIRRVYADGGRFAERRRRFGLHRWYDIKIDENIPLPVPKPPSRSFLEWLTYSLFIR